MPRRHFLGPRRTFSFYYYSSVFSSIFAPILAQVVAWEVRHLCEDLLPHSETRLLPAGRVLLGSLGEETDLRKSDEARYCSELFIMLTREILLKDAIGVAELEGPCRILHL
jgi:hypothetical protein